MRKYTFKPIYNLRSRRDVINLIKENQTKGLGGVLLEHVQESMTTDDYDRIFRVIKGLLNYDDSHSSLFL